MPNPRAADRCGRRALISPTVLFVRCRSAFRLAYEPWQPVFNVGFES